MTVPTLLVRLLVFVWPLWASPTTPPLVVWNDNDRAAGVLTDGVLALELEVARGLWHPLGEERAGIEIVAFREVGGDLQNPGPMIRVPEGTEVHVTVGNPLADTLVVYGLSSRQVMPGEGLVVPPGQSRTRRFLADAEGTWYYWGTTTGARFEERIHEDSQLHGAFIVDAPGEGAASHERAMIMSIWFPRPEEGEELDWAAETFAINGRPWPHTERMRYELGDRVTWRILNLTERRHPMHLHGFFFTVEAKGDNARDTLYWPAARRQAVTERIDVGGTVRLSWTPDRPGGWIFHCHISYHVVANALPGDYETGEERDHDLLYGHHPGDPNDHVVKGMGGLLMGIQVRAPEGWQPETRSRRRIRLFVQSDSTPEQRRRFGYLIGEEGRDAPPDSIVWPGPALVARVGEPTAVTVINRTREATQVHWHGLEIDSYYDGVTGFGGYPGHLTPVIAPADSFTMRITPPRAGSYMYHTHVSDIRQQSAGLYGPFIVLEEGEPWDPVTDLVFLASTGSDAEMSPLLNGTADPEPLTLRQGTAYRLRLMNITLFNAGLRFRLTGPTGYPIVWRHLAKDGADLPAHLQRRAFADQVVSVGETLDVSFQPGRPGDYRLELRSFRGFVFVEQTVRVLPDLNP